MSEGYWDTTLKFAGMQVSAHSLPWPSDYVYVLRFDDEVYAALAETLLDKGKVRVGGGEPEYLYAIEPEGNGYLRVEVFRPMPMRDETAP